MALLAVLPGPAVAVELRGSVGVEGRFFAFDPLAASQQDQNGSAFLEAEIYHQFNDGNSLTFSPFARLDSADWRRTHADIRELSYLYLADNWELRLGISKVFWGTTEFIHLVDIVNQTDAIEALDGEDKLGQPMAHLSIPTEYGVFDFFALPYFRERSFAGNRGRLRYALPVAMDGAVYESGAEQTHCDLALRYRQTIGDADVGISHFVGTGREPSLLPASGLDGMRLIPYYQQIQQTGFDLQMVAGEWLWKLEAIHRSGQGKSFSAATGGAEYSFVNLFETGMDLGLLMEMAWDERRQDASSFAENDIMTGLRLAVNDQAGTELLAGLIQDLDSQSRMITLEAGRRVGDRIKLRLEGSLFMDAPPDDLLYQLRRDDFVRLEVIWYF